MNCPLMSQSIPEKHHGSQVVWVDCIESNCQWWAEDNCIVFDINNSLKAMAMAVATTRPETVQPRQQEEEEKKDDLSFPEPIG